MSLPKPFYSDSSCTLYHADAREILPLLPPSDLLLTDPPYGIKRQPRKYDGGWDDGRPSPELFAACLQAARFHIIWGGNYFADLLPVQSKWLVWDKLQTMPSYSDCELAWTSLSGVSVKMFRYAGSGLTAVEKDRVHPTQEPLALMSWCLSLIPSAQTILDPFAGSGTTGRAAKDLGRKSVLIEREERYAEIIARRMQQEVLPLYEAIPEPEQPFLI